MVELAELELTPRVARSLPDWPHIMSYLRSEERMHSVVALREADRRGRPVVQPRCGVGGHDEMLTLLGDLQSAGPGILSVTIDSHTRLMKYEKAEALLRRDASDLNGYPLVTHGWERGRQLTEAVSVPLEVRHGSPDPRDLFAVAIASGITSFEGGGVSYNLPYSKDVALGRSLRAWQQVDGVCGTLAEAGVIVERELFGSLTAVLVPPSISLAVTLLEAIAARREGVRCVSLAYPQGGEVHQDVAALRATRSLARRYLGDDVESFAVLHQFMGAFPETPEFANMLILQGGLVARLGGAAKVVNKTIHEAFGVPDAASNALGIRTTTLGASEMLDFVRIDDGRVAEECEWIEREVAELIEPVLAGPDLLGSIEAAFASGRLDIPFSPSVHARSDVIPRRDQHGCIRFAATGALPFSGPTRRRNAELVDEVDPAAGLAALLQSVTADIYYLLDRERRCLRPDTPRRSSWPSIR